MNIRSVSFLKKFAIASASLFICAAAPLMACAANTATDAVNPATSLTRFWELPPSGKDGLVVSGTNAVHWNFTPQEALCKSRYGDEWFSICGRKTGLAGKNSTSGGVSLAAGAGIQGSWFWETDNSLVFQPDGAWPAGQVYTAAIPAALWPGDTELSGSLSFRSAEIMPRVAGEFKFDPHDLSTMAISGAISFNYPMDEQSVFSKFRLSTPGNTQADSIVPLLGETALHWADDERRVLMFSVPVLSLPDQGSTVAIRLDPGYMAGSGGQGGKSMDAQIRLPGKSSLFTLNAVQSLVSVTDTMRARQTLALEFSLPALAGEVQPAIQALLLPRQRVEANKENGDDKQPYAWWNMTEITPEVLEKAKPVGLSLEENMDLPSLLISLDFDQELEPGRTLLVTVPADITGADGLALTQESRVLVQIPSFQEELRIMQNGAVLGLSGDKTLSLYSRNLDNVEYLAYQVRPEFLNHFVSNNYGSFGNPHLYTPSMDQLSVVTRGTLPLVRKNAQNAQFSSLDLAPMLKNGPKGLFWIQLNGTREGNTINTEQRFVLVTDLGIIHKRSANGESVVFVASLEGEGPARSVDVKILGANGLPVFEGKTDREGKVDVPDLTGLPPEKTPVAILVTKGEDLAFLPFQDEERSVNYSRFDVGGNRSVNGLDAFLFGERDLYRPGDTVHFGFILKQGSWDTQHLQDLPLKAVVYDARGNEFASTRLNLDASGLGELEYPLPETAPTGAWYVDLALNTGDDARSGVVLQSQRFRVEEFQPDTLRLSLNLTPSSSPYSEGWLRSSKLGTPPLQASGQLMNLFGAAASGNRVIGKAMAMPAFFSFRAYPEWRFHDAAPLAAELGADLSEKKSDEQGEFSWNIPSRLYSGHSTRLTVQTEAFDAGGGRSVQAYAGIMISPLEYVVGWRSMSNLGYLRQGSEASVEFMALNPSLEPVAVNNLSLETVAVTYVKSLIKDENGQYRYDHLRQEEVLSSREFSLSKGEHSIELDLSKPGQRLLRLRDMEGTVLASAPYTVAGDAVASFGQDREPAFTARLDKQDYEPGDEVEIFMSTPYQGAGLITVERDKVVTQTWFTSQAGDQIKHIRLPRDFEGRAYLNVTYFRSLEDKDIFTKPLAVAVIPFTVNMDRRDLGLKLELPHEAIGGKTEKEALPVIRPGKAFTVRISAKNEGRAIVWAVDEGILQMTSYRSPDPLTELLTNRALRVQTYQYLDLLMPEHKLMRSALSAFGGGEGLNFANMGQNPFRRPGEKPAVFWSGILDVDSGGVDVSIPVPPHFNGQLRIMAVACAPEAVSSARSDVLAQAEVVIQPSLPLFVAPGDEFDAAITLTDMSGFAPHYDGQSKNQGRALNLSVDTGTGLQLLSDLPQDLRLFDARQQTLRLRFRALDSLGGHSLNFTVAPPGDQKGQSVSRPVGLSVRPAMARTTQSAMGRLYSTPSGTSYRAIVPVTRQLYPQFSAFSASLSPLPLPLAQSFLRYLENYPYACTEQLVSAAFPALILCRYPELAPQEGSYTKEALETRIRNTLSMLSQRLQGDGFSIWPGGQRGNLFLSVYVADFLTTAEEMGVAVPLRLKRDLLSTLAYYASQVPGDLEDARTFAYAAWVLTRNGEISSNILATLGSWLTHYAQGWEQDIVALFMAGTWQMMLQADEAERLLQGFKPGTLQRKEEYDWFDALAQRAFYLTVLAGQFPEQLHSDDAQTALDEMLQLASTRSYATVSAAQSARAVMLYSRGLTPGMENAELSAQDQEGQNILLPLRKNESAIPSLFVQENTPEITDSAPLLSRIANLTFRADGPLWWHMESTGFDRELPAQTLQQGMEIRRELRRPDGEPATLIRQGDEIIVTIIARAHGKSLSNVAITDLLPGGFEMVLAQGGEAVTTGTSLGAQPSDRTMSVEYVERREDRLLLFPTLDTENSVFRYRVKAVTPGVYTLPPISAEAMYMPDIYAHGETGKIEIK